MQGLIQQLGSGALGIGSILAWTSIALVLAMAGGAIAAIPLAGKDLGIVLASLMGMLFGPVAAVPGILVGLLVLKWL